jgi:hypothetical protein
LQDRFYYNQQHGANLWNNPHRTGKKFQKYLHEPTRVFNGELHMIEPYLETHYTDGEMTRLQEKENEHYRKNVVSELRV